MRGVRTVRTVSAPSARPRAPLPYADARCGRNRANPERRLRRRARAARHDDGLDREDALGDRGQHRLNLLLVPRRVFVRAVPLLRLLQHRVHVVVVHGGRRGGAAVAEGLGTTMMGGEPALGVKKCWGRRAPRVFWAPAAHVRAPAAREAPKWRCLAGERADET